MTELSEGARIILRHLRDKKFRQMDYELPAALEALFAQPRDCEAAQEELESLGLVTLGRAPPSHIPLASRVRATALTREGEFYIEENEL